MSNQTETAILAGGCFWGMEELVRKMPGVLSTRVGYTGGDVPDATYRNHAGHAEALEIVFDPAQLGFCIQGDPERAEPPRERECPDHERDGDDEDRPAEEAGAVVGIDAALHRLEDEERHGDLGEGPSEGRADAQDDPARVRGPDLAHEAPATAPRVRGLERRDRVQISMLGRGRRDGQLPASARSGGSMMAMKSSLSSDDGVTGETFGVDQ